MTHITPTNTSLMTKNGSSGLTTGGGAMGPLQLSHLHHHHAHANSNNNSNIVININTSAGAGGPGGVGGMNNGSPLNTSSEPSRLLHSHTANRSSSSSSVKSEPLDMKVDSGKGAADQHHHSQQPHSHMAGHHHHRSSSRSSRLFDHHKTEVVVVGSSGGGTTVSVSSMGISSPIPSGGEGVGGGGEGISPNSDGSASQTQTLLEHQQSHYLDDPRNLLPPPPTSLASSHSHLAALAPHLLHHPTAALHHHYHQTHLQQMSSCSPFSVDSLVTGSGGQRESSPLLHHAAAAYHASSPYTCGYSNSTPPDEMSLIPNHGQMSALSPPHAHTHEIDGYMSSSLARSAWYSASAQTLANSNNNNATTESQQLRSNATGNNGTSRLRSPLNSATSNGGGFESPASSVGSNSSTLSAPRQPPSGPGQELVYGGDSNNNGSPLSGYASSGQQPQLGFRQSAYRSFYST